MVKHTSIFHYLLISFFMLSMLLPVVHADNAMGVGHEMSQANDDCHSSNAHHAAADVSTHCATECHCAAANCHAAGVISFQPLLDLKQSVQTLVLSANAQLVSQHPSKFKRPPRS